MREFSYVVDYTFANQDKFIPGTGMTVQTREFFLADEPDNIVILAPIFAGYLTHSLLSDGYKGRIIVMLPSIYIDQLEDHQ